MLLSVEEVSSTTKIILALLGGGLLAHASNFLLQWQKNTAASRRADTQQDIAAQAAQNDRYEARLQLVETEVRDCRNKHANCEREYGYMKGRVDEMCRTIQVLQNNRLVGPGQAVINFENPEDSSIELASEEDIKNRGTNSPSSDIMVM